jgi:predicted Zn finger-like uncharacterized protein
MLLSCPNCNASFSVSDTFEFQSKNKYVQCCKCMHIWDVSQGLGQAESKLNDESHSRGSDFIDNPLKQGINSKAKDALSTLAPDEKTKSQLSYSHLLIAFALIIGVLFLLYKEHKRYTFCENNIIIKDANFSIIKNDLHVRYSLLNLSNQSIMLNKITVIFLRDKKMRVISEYIQPILLKPMQVKKVCTSFSIAPNFDNNVVVSLKLG